MEYRKVIHQGKGTLTMSLPSKWTRELGITPGDELGVEQRGLQLVVSPSVGRRRGKKTEIDLKGLSKGLVYVVMNNCYIRGDDEVKLLLDSPEQHQAVLDGISQLIGFEIVEHSQKSCTIAELALSEREEFDTLLRRIFLILLSMADDGASELAKKKPAPLIPIAQRDHTVNKLVAYCLRVLNKKGGVDVNKAMHLYTTLTLLEQLGDQYSRFYHEVNAVKPTTAQLCRRIATLLRQFYELFYTFNKTKASAIKDERDRLRKEINTTFPKLKTRDDLLALHHLRQIGDLIIDLQKFQMAMQI
ncbi:hypothetical protein HY490_03010 [Candidatus Woesearchaeota archaeon]|nr:hypothetical protein [Candidatus Woesearchaeota archaeon]